MPVTASQFETRACTLCNENDYVRAPHTTSKFTHGASAIFICRNCGMTPYFSSISSKYAELMKDSYYDDYYTVEGRSGKLTKYNELAISRFAKLEEFCDLNGKFVLDVGCGEGQILQLLKEKGAICRGLEPMSKTAQALRDRGFDVFIGLLDEYQHTDAQKFDATVLYYVLDAMKDPVGELRRLRAITRDDGYLFVHIGSVYRQPFWSRSPLRLLRKALKSFWPKQTSHDYHPYYFTRRTLLAGLGAAGFDPVYISDKFQKHTTIVAKAGNPKPLENLNCESWPVLWFSFFLWRIFDWLIRPPYDLAVACYRMKKYGGSAVDDVSGSV